MLAHFIDWPLTAITRKDIKQWMATMNARRTYGRATPKSKKAKKANPRPTAFLHWQTKTHAINLLRRAFARAIEEEKVPADFANPCIGFTFKKPPRVEEPWNYLTRDEIVALQKVAPPLLRSIIEFAIATGLRAGEDVHAEEDAPYITVRYGKPPRKPTKSGHPREVPLLPMAVRALREWTALRAAWCTENDKGLVFPAQRGGHRSEGKMLGRRHQELWRGMLRQAGIQKPLVWHDLRHTCGTALLGGYFGRKWRLEEIQQLLGHADVKTTERYAHALKQTLHDAARETAGDINGKE
jgi:integrase